MPKGLIVSDVRSMADADIRAKVTELEEERFRLEFRSATETLDDPLQLRWIRRDVARLKTVLRERALGSTAQSDAADGVGGGAA
jgi:large subunit ribosomal protein L29